MSRQWAEKGGVVWAREIGATSCKLQAEKGIQAFEQAQNRDEHVCAFYPACVCVCGLIGSGISKWDDELASSLVVPFRW